jgi:phosphoribosyl-AMP cyclohydrolase
MVRFDPSSFIGELGLPRLCDYHIGDVVRLLTGEDISFHEDDGMAYVAAYLFTKLCGNTRHKAFYHDAVFRMTTDPDGLVMKVSQGASDLHHHLALVIRTSGDYAIRVCSQQEDNHDVSRTGMWKRGEYSGAMVKISNIDPAKPWGLRLGLFLEHVTSGTPA